MRKLLLLSIFVAGCIDAGDATDDTFVETIVTIASDGSQTVETRDITLDEELAINDAREQGRAPLIHQDPGASLDSVWLYDRTDLTGNVIRLVKDNVSGPEEAVFADALPRRYRVGYFWVDANWAIPSGSYYSGRYTLKLFKSNAFGIQVQAPPWQTGSWSFAPGYLSTIGML